MQRYTASQYDMYLDTDATIRYTIRYFIMNNIHINTTKIKWSNLNEVWVSTLKCTKFSVLNLHKYRCVWYRFRVPFNEIINSKVYLG